jgi:hypothetical protein
MIGGALLGIGANINSACVFGAIARFGSGEWTYIVTPAGFYLGCLSVVPLFGVPTPRGRGGRRLDRGTLSQRTVVSGTAPPLPCQRHADGVGQPASAWWQRRG